MNILRVNLDDRGYDIAIGPGLVGEVAARVRETLGETRCAIVTDETVGALYAETLETALSQAGLHLGTISVPAGEASKSFATLEQVCDGLLGMGVERGDAVIALGGGVIGDLAGFAAAILRRGVRMVQIPTSLLAQVDSAVGGKTAVNSTRGKNLLGAFHQPSLVLIDTDVLSTLPERQMRSGYAEVVKYGLLGDAAFFDWLDAHWRSVFGNDTSALTRAIETSCAAKAGVVARDEREHGERALLNLGHTFGHALEAFTGYGERLLHGEAVAIGMALAFRFSHHLGHAPASSAERVEAHLRAVGLPTRISDIPSTPRPTAAALVDLMAQDKKVERGKLVFILVKDIGEAFIARDVDAAQVLAFLETEVR
ncbi:MAG: 3-dehydroquinate synthase [Pseudomonadota bacterium]